jgi:hypothetical protein
VIATEAGSRCAGRAAAGDAWLADDDCDAAFGATVA